mmetsp:Transcript_5792/g.10121  ORF Transcript_5792/g.10121 Transcript_5792/m.10121 type:complete len:205 (-) Transcript_5792:65-679(-)
MILSIHYFQTPKTFTISHNNDLAFNVNPSLLELSKVLWATIISIHELGRCISTWGITQECHISPDCVRSRIHLQLVFGKWSRKSLLPVCIKHIKTARNWVTQKRVHRMNLGVFQPKRFHLLNRKFSHRSISRGPCHVLNRCIMSQVLLRMLPQGCLEHNPFKLGNLAAIAQIPPSLIRLKLELETPKRHATIHATRRQKRPNNQ